MFDWTSAKTRVRKAVHDTFRVPVQLEAVAAPGTLVDLHVRWHDKLTMVGNIVEAGYADVLEGIDRIIFEREELVEKGVLLRRGDEVRFGPAFQGTVLILDTSEPSDGPVNVIWKVTRK